MSQSATLLVIDDEPQIRKFLRISLASQGYKVLEAATGAQGLAQAALGKPDLVVLDLGLPDMDGQQVLRDLREWSAVPVMVLSVRASELQKVDALDGGANDYVTKPFGIQEYALLAQLAGHPGRVITQQQLLKDIWGPTHVDDTHYLRIVVGHLRQKLGDDPTAPRFIITEAGVGYRLVAPAA